MRFQDEEQTADVDAPHLRAPHFVNYCASHVPTKKPQSIVTCVGELRACSCHSRVSFATAWWEISRGTDADAGSTSFRCARIAAHIIH